MNLPKSLYILVQDVLSEIFCRSSSGWTVSRPWVQPFVLTIRRPVICDPFLITDAILAFPDCWDQSLR